ncbi:MAG: SDR family oxidoreductase [Candidatus Eremiobacteraeota bacterium]|nr:SDR family oxidoreductase [Candidatus Eremiobacteraeota bacterium]
MNSDAYAGKTVLITGGGSGLGRSMALTFAAHRATVCVTGRRQDALDETVKLIVERGGKAFGLCGDVRDCARVQEVVDETVSRAGGLDVLVNNAAGNFVAPSETLSPNGFKSVVDIVLNGTFYCSRAAFPALKKSRGSIINIIATYAWSGEPGAVHSACAKAGVLAMTRTLAAEWGAVGIRVNAIAPGPIHTEGTDKNLWSVAGVVEAVEAQIPLGRLGEPEDVAKAALWLCSPDAAWISGAALPVDGAHWLSGGTLDFRKMYDRAAAGMTGRQE